MADENNIMFRNDAKTIADLREQIATLREGRATHTAQIEAVKTTLGQVQADTQKILEFMQASKGSWKFIVGAGTVIGGIIEAGHWAFQAFHK